MDKSAGFLLRSFHTATTRGMDSQTVRLIGADIHVVIASTPPQVTGTKLCICIIINDYSRYALTPVAGVGHHQTNG